MLSGSEKAYCKTLDQFGPSYVLRSRIIDAKLTGGSRVIYKVPKKRNRIVAASNSNHLSRVCASKYVGALQICKHKRFLNCNNTFGRRMGMVYSECLSNDSSSFIDGNGRNLEYVGTGDGGSSSEHTDGLGSASSREAGGEAEAVETDALTVDELRELLQKAMTELEVARLNSTMFEEKAQKISEAAIALQDEAAHAWNDVNSALDSVQQIVNEEYAAKEAVQKATMALSLAEARLQVAIESLELAKGNDSPETSTESEGEIDGKEKQEVLLVAQEDIKECCANLETCDAELKRLQSKKEELQKEVDRLNELAEKAQLNALKAEEDVANIMLLAEQAVAFELEAAQRVSDAEIILQRVEKSISNSFVDTLETTQVSNIIEEVANEDNKAVLEISGDIAVEIDRDLPLSGDSLVIKSFPGSFSDSEDSDQPYDLSDSENGKLNSDSLKEVESGAEKSILSQAKKQETQKDLTREGSSLNSPKALLKKSSRFFSASFFSFSADGEEFTPALVFQGLLDSTKKQLPKLIVGVVLLGAGYAPTYSLSFLHLCLEEYEGP